MDFSDKYKQAKQHKGTHKSCGGEPYKSYDRLFEVVRGFALEVGGGSAAAQAQTQTPEKLPELRVLEIGTAVGFTTFVLQSAILNDQTAGVVETIEHHAEHIDEAKINIAKWGGDISKIIFHTGQAENILETLNNNSFDIIFFDGYGVKKHFYENFSRILNTNGLLIVANIFLKSTEQEFFGYLEDKKLWEFVEEFADTRVYRKNLL